MRVKATLTWCGARRLLATPAPQVECRRAPTLTSTSATAQVVRRLADKATSCNVRNADANANGLAKCDTYGHW